jgi:hypothetical protein
MGQGSRDGCLSASRFFVANLFGDEIVALCCGLATLVGNTQVDDYKRIPNGDDCLTATLVWTNKQLKQCVRFLPASLHPYRALPKLALLRFGD